MGTPDSLPRWHRRCCTDQTMRLSLRVATLLTVAHMLGVVTVQAQTSSPAPGGGPSAGWVFTPRVGMGGAWDDNVLLVNPADRPPPDYASPISPSISLDYIGRRTQVSSGYSGSWVLYRRLEQLNSFDQGLRLVARHRATQRLTLFAQEEFNVAPSTDAVQLIGVPFYRIGTRTNALTGGFESTLSARTTVSGGYTRRSVDFDPVGFGGDEPIAFELQGGHAHEVVLTLLRSVSSRLAVGGEYAFTRAIVGGGEQGEAGILEDRFDIQRGSVTASYRLTPTVGVTGGLGVAQLGGGLAHEARTGPTWAVGVTRRARRTMVSANYRRSYVPSFGFGGTFQNEEFAASLLVPFARGRAYVDSSVSWFDNDSLTPGQPSLQTVSSSSVLGYRATRWLSAEGYYIRTQQDAQRAGGQLRRNQIGFRMVAAKPVRLR